MLFEDLNWMDVEEYLQHNDRLIVVTGATEQHAYLSLFTDIRIPMALATAVAQRTHVLVAPPLNFGVSDYFMAYPGTITLSQATFDLVITDIITSAVQHGFRRILILNGHGGNKFPEGVRKLAGEVDDLRIVWHNWWQSPVAKQIADEIGEQPNHANWLENFPFTRVANSPEEPKPMLELEPGVMPTREVLGDGSFGGAYQVDDEIMVRFFDMLVDEIVDIMKNL